MWGRITDWTDSFCEIGLPLYGLLLRARALGSPQKQYRELEDEGTVYPITDPWSDCIYTYISHLPSKIQPHVCNYLDPPVGCQISARLGLFWVVLLGAQISDLNGGFRYIQ